jgi:hypothetical protein
MRMMTLLALLGTSTVVSAQTRKVDVTHAVGQPPKGFEFGQTAKVVSPGRWVVQAEGANKFLAQLDADRTGLRFPVAVLADVEAADVDLRVDGPCPFRAGTPRVRTAIGCACGRRVRHGGDDVHGAGEPDRHSPSRWP